jgi:hypothetical protein
MYFELIVIYVDVGLICAGESEITQRLRELNILNRSMICKKDSEKKKDSFFLWKNK